MIDIGRAMLFIMFDQVLAKGRIQAGKITGNDMPEKICSDYGRLCTVKPK